MGKDKYFELLKLAFFNIYFFGLTKIMCIFATNLLITYFITMSKAKEKKEMKDFVGRYFIRVCKNHDLYNTFKGSFSKYKNREEHTPFGKYKNIHELLTGLFAFTTKDIESKGMRNNDYEKVTMMINHMIHFFLEKGGVDPRRLGAIGQEVFDLACYGLYGDKFLEDMENFSKQNEQEVQINSDKEAWLYGEFLKLKKRGQLPESARWSEFRSFYLPKLKHLSTPENNGHYSSYDEEEWLEEE